MENLNLEAYGVQKMSIEEQVDKIGGVHPMAIAWNRWNNVRGWCVFCWIDYL